jgi:peptide deformylase
MEIIEIIKLGNEQLHKSCDRVLSDDPKLETLIHDLHDTLADFKLKNSWGQTIAAPQIGILKRITYVNIDNPWVIINPVLDSFGKEYSEGYDACLSFPHLLVKVRRPVSCVLTYRDLQWQEKRVELSGSLCYLLQHECDHLNGILATQRATDESSIITREEYKRTRNT